MTKGKAEQALLNFLELLAVFLVLGVILAIAVPKISNVRDDSLKRSFMISVENIMKEIKNQNQ